MRRAAAEARAEIVALELLTPYALAPAITLEVEDPAAFVRYRLERFLDGWDDPERYEGSYVWIADRRGDVVWYSAVDNRNGPGSGGTRPDLEGCDPFGSLSGGVEAPDPQPCPA